MSWQQNNSYGYDQNLYKSNESLLESSKHLDTSVIREGEEIENNQSFLVYSFKEKNYNPSRFLMKDKLPSISAKSKHSLHILENKLTKLDDKLSTLNPEDSIEQKVKVQKKGPLYPLLKNVSQSVEFKTKPLNKREADFMLFKEIFVAPKEKVLKVLKDKQRNNIQELQKITTAEKKKQSLDNSMRSLHIDIDMDTSLINKKDDYNLDQILKEAEKEPEETKGSYKNFFDQQIQVNSNADNKEILN